MTQLLFLTSDEVQGLASPEEYVEAVREGYRQRGRGAPAEPRTTLTNDSPPGMLTGYLSILPETGMGGYTYAAGFGEKDAWFFTPLFDAETGEPLALIDGASMNPFKTGAAGAVGVDALARDDAETLGIIGSGSQARGQLKSVATVRDLETVKVFSPTKENREEFAREMNEYLANVEVTPVETSADAVEGSNIVVTATTATEPVFPGEALEDGTHVTAMGQYHPRKRELDIETIKHAKYVPDLRERAFQDAGSFLRALDDGAIDEDHVYAELGEVVAGVEEGRESSDDITVFDSGGTAIETVAAARMLYDKAVDRGLGETIELSKASDALTGRE